MTDAPDALPPGPWEADPTPIGGTYFIHSPIKTVAAAYDLQTAYAIAAIPEREREIERLRGSNKQLADIVTDQEDRRLKAEARVAELEAALSDVLRNVMPYHQSWRIWDRIRTILAAKPTGEA